MVVFGFFSGYEDIIDNVLDVGQFDFVLFYGLILIFGNLFIVIRVGVDFFGFGKFFEKFFGGMMLVNLDDLILLVCYFV